MSKTIVAAVLIILAGGSWLYLDYLNNKETAAVEEMRKEMQISHARAVADMKELVEMRTRIELSMVTDLTSCYAAAERANFDYLSHLQNPDIHKRDQISISKADIDQAAMTLESDKEKCQKTYDLRAKNLVN